MLTNDALDPVAKIPEFKVCAVRMEKLVETVAGTAVRAAAAGRAAGELMARK